MLEAIAVATEELGDRSYIVHDGEIAIVVDPQRDLDRLESLLVERSLGLELVLETHLHNDYVSGGLELARRTGATYVVAAQDEVSFERRAVADGDELVAGGLRVRVVATPGHTEKHLAYVVEAEGETPLLMSGGSLLYGSVGRTDLVGSERTEDLTRQQYRSARRLAAMLPDDARILPTHGFGSFCSSGAATGGDSSTVGAERDRNDALVIDDEDKFVTSLVAGLEAYPSYYVHMGPRNRRGAGAVDLTPPSIADPAELRARIARGEWVVDLRARAAYAACHIGGTLCFPLEQPFATYLGWLIPWDTPLTLLAPNIEMVGAAQRQLVRIGIDRPAAAALGTPRELAKGAQLRRYPVVSIGEVPRDASVHVLDVRRASERIAGWLPGSLHIPLHELASRLDELPAGALWVHCAGGFRASIATGLLDRAGRDVVLIDDDFSNAESAGHVLERPAVTVKE